jgi:hypothetical protein
MLELSFEIRKLRWNGGGGIIPAIILVCIIFTGLALAQGHPTDPSKTIDESAKIGQAKKAENPASAPAPDSDGQKEGDKGKPEKRGEWLLAPIPISSPAIGSGIEWVAGYVFPFSKQDKVSPDSVAGAGGLFTNNGSRAIAVGTRMYIKEDRYRITVAGGGARINADIYGIGKFAGDNGLFLPLTFKGGAFITESIFQIRKHMFLGPRFQYRNMSMSLNPEGEMPANPGGILDQLGPDLFKQRTVAIGPRFQWDSRDNTYYPRKGVFLDSGIDLFSEGLGSKFTYQFYKLAFNKYTSLSKSQVLAFRGMACAAAGDHVPIYDLCLFGSSNDVRGYTAGRYQDRRMFATQAEYRLTLPLKGFMSRFGVVAFAGVGGVAAKVTDFGFSDLLPGGGGGLRFRLTKQNPINFRIDYGVGTQGHTLSMGVAEAF